MSAPVLKVPFFSPALTQPGDFSGGRCISPFHRPRYKVSGFSPAGASAQASPARSNPIFRCSSTCTLRRMGPSSCVTASLSTRVITRGGVCPQVDTTRVRFANCQCFVAAVCQQNLEPGPLHAGRHEPQYRRFVINESYRHNLRLPLPIPQIWFVRPSQVCRWFLCGVCSVRPSRCSLRRVAGPRRPRSVEGDLIVIFQARAAPKRFFRQSPEG